LGATLAAVGGLTSLVGPRELHAAAPAFRQAVSVDRAERLIRNLESDLQYNTVVGVAAALVLVLLAVLVCLPWPAARILAWCAAAAIPAVFGCGLAVSPELVAMGNQNDPVEVQRAQENLLPFLEVRARRPGGRLQCVERPHLHHLSHQTCGGIEPRRAWRFGI
jgi:hypothetical protein